MMGKLGRVLCLSVGLWIATLQANQRNVDLVQETQNFVHGKNVAVVVGIENYNPQHSAFSPLAYAADDAIQLTTTLGRKGYTVKRLLNHEAQRHYILNQIRNAGKLVPNGNGTLVFSFAGHGSVIGHENYLATAGADGLDLPRTGLRVSEVVETIRSTGIKRAILLLDACRDTPNSRNGGRTGFLDQDYGEGIQVLYATKLGDISWEHKDLQQGVFSYFVSRGLAGEAAQQGVVTFSSLAAYVEREVPKWTNNKKLSRVQLPFRTSAGEYRGDFVMARVGNTSAPPSQRPRPPQPNNTPQIVNSVPHTPSIISSPSISLPPDTRRKTFEPEMVQIRGGAAKLGCLSGYNCKPGENIRIVNVPRFFMSKYEITFDQWDRCVLAGGCDYSPHDEGWGRGKMPVINISWHDARQYIRWLNKETRQNYSLPTDVQWEYAARAGVNTIYSWGNNIDCRFVSYNDCRLPKTTMVGSFRANNFGLFDMLGNVSEWTIEQSLRGGAWGDKPENLRIAYKFRKPPITRGKTLGFRVVKNIR